MAALLGVCISKERRWDVPALDPLSGTSIAPGDDSSASPAKEIAEVAATPPSVKAR